MESLKGKVAIVTGASSGIGRAVASQLADKGAVVVVAARRQQLLQSLVAQIEAAGGRAIAVAGDVREEAFAKTLVDRAEECFGGVDIAFNNAGTLGRMGPVQAMSLEDWNHTLASNLSSGFLGAKYQIPAMLARGGGSLIFTSSFVGHSVGFPGMAAYAASKAGLVGLVQALAAECGPNGIRVNAILPGGTDTAMGREVADSPESVAAVAAMHALKRLALAEEIARSVLYLASDASSFVTGTALRVDGGISVNRS